MSGGHHHGLDFKYTLYDFIGLSLEPWKPGTGMGQRAKYQTKLSARSNWKADVVADD